MLPVFISNLLFVYSANFVNGLLGIVSIPVVVSYLGKEQYGIFSIYTVLASYVALVDCGVTKHFVRLIASDRSSENQRACLQKALGWYLVLFTILIVLLPLVIYFVVHFLFPVSIEHQRDLRLIVIAAVIEFFLMIPTIMSQTLTVANEQFGKFSRFNFITGLYRYGLMLAAAIVFKTPAVVVCFLVSRRLVDIYCAKKLMLWPEKRVWRPRINFYEFKSILARSSILSLAQFLQTTIVAIGSILVNRYFGTLALGNYRAAFDLGSKIWFISNGIGLLVFPRFSKTLTHFENRNEIAHRLYRLLTSSWLLYLLLALCCVLGAKFILPLIKLDAQQIVIFFMILFMGFCINAHSNVAYEFILADGRYATVTVLSISSLVLLYSIFMVLKNSVGVYAIAWAWVITQSVYGILVDELILSRHFIFDSGHIKLLIIKIGLLMLTMACLVAEVYAGNFFSKSATFSAVVGLTIYTTFQLRPMIDERFRKKNDMGSN